MSGSIILFPESPHKPIIPHSVGQLQVIELVAQYRNHTKRNTVKLACVEEALIFNFLC